jgi:hypothetical protein
MATKDLNRNIKRLSSTNLMGNELNLTCNNIAEDNDNNNNSLCNRNC